MCQPNWHWIRNWCSKDKECETSAERSVYVININLQLDGTFASARKHLLRDQRVIFLYVFRLIHAHRPRIKLYCYCFFRCWFPAFFLLYVRNLILKGQNCQPTRFLCIFTSKLNSFFLFDLKLKWIINILIIYLMDHFINGMKMICFFPILYILETAHFNNYVFFQINCK